MFHKSFVLNTRKYGPPRVIFKARKEDDLSLSNSAIREAIMRKKSAALILATTVLQAAMPAWSAVTGYNAANIEYPYVVGWRVTASDDPESDEFFHVSIAAKVEPADYEAYYPLSEYGWTWYSLPLDYCHPGSFSFYGDSASSGAGHLDRDYMGGIVVNSMSQCS
jgi:hypothetical protein